MDFRSRIVSRIPAAVIRSTWRKLKFVLVPGKSSVTGRAVLALADGQLKDCAGFNVEMLPVTAYASERIAKSYGNVQRGQILLEQNPPKFVPDVKEYHELLLKSSCDAQGVFRFENVPAGDYFVMAFLIWEEKSGDSTRKTGGALMHRLRVGADDRVAIEMERAGEHQDRLRSTRSGTYRLRRRIGRSATRRHYA